MDDVTDTAFRQVVAETAAPDLFFTEFASVDGLQSRGRDNVMRKLKFDRPERPLIAQVWGLKPENYLKTARELAGMGFDGIDINMGCPTPVVTKKGACSALINNRALAAEIIAATKEGAGALPVSVKTRIGFKTKVTEDWCGFLLAQDLAALTIHGRTAKEMSKVPNHWDEIAKVAPLRDRLAPETILIGNGDVESCQQGTELAQRCGLDGIMIGRGIFKNPWIFNGQAHQIDQKRQLKLFVRHIELFEQAWQGKKNPNVLKKFAKMYVNHFEGAVEMRTQIMTAKTLEQLRDIVLRLAETE